MRDSGRYPDHAWRHCGGVYVEASVTESENVYEFKGPGEDRQGKIFAT